MKEQSDFQLWQLAFLARLNRRFENTAAEEILAWSASNFGGGLALGTSFGASGMVLIDLALRIDPDVDIFYIDTGYFFPETHELIQRAQDHFGRSFRRVSPAETVDQQELNLGPRLYNSDPDLCCHQRKVVPMEKALQGRTAWMSALRRDQADTRRATAILRWSERHGLVKIAPLARWTEDDIWRHIRGGGLPYNSLHDAHYPSIGCWPCTHPVVGDEDLRAGRWSGLGKTECGLHWAQGQPA